MQAKKEIRAGRLYIQATYSAGMLPGLRPAARRERQKVQSEAKRRINAVERQYHLVQLFEVNFKAGRDLFIELSFADAPDDKEEKKVVERFHRRMKAHFKRKGRVYKYIIVRETHNRDGQPVRVHYHLVCTATGKRMRDVICKCWDAGSVDVRTLRDAFGGFEDTCRYLLKERKEKNERAFRASRNLKRPEEPLRRRIRESEAGEVPPGIEIIKMDMNGSNPYGRYTIIVGRIVDLEAFDRYWAKAKLDRRKWEENRNWKRYARDKKKKLTDI